MVGRPSIVFTRKAVVDQTQIRNSTNVCKSIVRTDVNQRYPYSICQLWLQDYTQDMSLIQICKSSIPVRTNPEISKIGLCRTFNEWIRTPELRTFTQHDFKKRVTVSIQMGSKNIATQCLKQWVVSIITLLVKRHELL